MVMRSCNPYVNNGELLGLFQLYCVGSHGILWRLYFNLSGFHLISLQ